MRRYGTLKGTGSEEKWKAKFEIAIFPGGGLGGKRMVLVLFVIGDSRYAACVRLLPV